MNIVESIKKIMTFRPKDTYILKDKNDHYEADCTHKKETDTYILKLNAEIDQLLNEISAIKK